ncbi:MAG: hypothetical protein ACR2GY_02280 [Phycisphaerales bacterium]
MTTQSSQTSSTSPATTARLRLVEKHGSVGIFKVPGTEYRLHLQTNPALSLKPGDNGRGEVHMTALRMHQSDTGGQFIEPVMGEPRIVHGLVRAVDRTGHRVLFDIAVPVWVAIQPKQSIDDFVPGAMWNCHVASGASFHLAD